MISGEPYGITLGEPYGFTLGAHFGLTLGISLGSSGGMRCGPLSRFFVSVSNCFAGRFSIGCISGRAWICSVDTWLMFYFLKCFWMSSIATIFLSARFFNACTSSFNAIVAFSDADLNGIAHPWGGGSIVSYILNLLVLWD